MIARRDALLGAVPQHRFVNLERLRIHYLEWENSGPPLLLVHGTGFHAYVWKPIAQLLSQTFRVIGIDQRGHGDSGKPEGGYTWDNFGEDLHRFLDHLGWLGIPAVGHSAGATAIAYCAAHHPGSIGRAVLIDPILVSKPADGATPQNPLAHRARKRRMVWESRTSMFHSYRTRAPFNSWREDVLWAYIEEGTVLRPDGHIELKCPGVIEAEIFDNAASVDGFAILPRVTIPVLVLRGETSDAFSEAGANTAASLLPNATFKTIARASHFVPMERPDAVERAVRGFLRR
ncbi:MAG TPA: alpha/beta hydrolase [Candidatus Binatia bacterium]|nr:alpha/beta hydrolase [Candidatus Binatia bacterium]